jgi:hypothetical protein
LSGAASAAPKACKWAAAPTSIKQANDWIPLLFTESHSQNGCSKFNTFCQGRIELTGILLPSYLEP